MLQNTELLEDRSSLMLLAAVLPPSVVYRRAILIDLGTRDFATGTLVRVCVCGMAGQWAVGEYVGMMIPCIFSQIQCCLRALSILLELLSLGRTRAGMHWFLFNYPLVFDEIHAFEMRTDGISQVRLRFDRIDLHTCTPLSHCLILASWIFLHSDTQEWHFWLLAAAVGNPCPDRFLILCAL